MNLRDIRLSEKNRSDGLHILAPGCIINIKHKLHDDGGRKIVSVVVLADQYDGKEWHLPDFGSTGINVRVAEGKLEQLPFTVEPDKARGAGKVIHIGYRGRVWRLEFHQSGGSGYFATCTAQAPDLSLFLGEFRRTDSSDFWPRIFEGFTVKAQIAIKNTYKLVEGG